MRPFAYPYFKNSFFLQMKISISTIPAAFQALYCFFPWCICRTQILRPHVSILIRYFKMLSVSCHISHLLFQNILLRQSCAFLFRRYYISKRKIGTTRIPACFTRHISLQHHLYNHSHSESFFFRKIMNLAVCFVYKS